MTYRIDTVAFKKKMLDEGFNSFSSLAEETGLSRDTVSAVANGKRKPSMSVMEKLASSMHMTPQEAGSIFFVALLRNS